MTAIEGYGTGNAPEVAGHAGQQQPWQEQQAGDQDRHGQQGYGDQGYSQQGYSHPGSEQDPAPVSGQGASTHGDRRLTPADVHAVRFRRGTMVHPGYADAEVDHFLTRVADELRRLHAEKGKLRDQVHALQAQVDGAVQHEAPSDQAVRIIAIAQQTADTYVAEAESYSRTATQQAREQYEEQLRRARENAGAIIQAAQEAADSIAAGGGGSPAAGRSPSELSEDELQEQVRYLKAFGQAVRAQLRAYLEALLSDVETEWGRADPSSLPQSPIRTQAQRSDRGATATRLHEREPNVAEVLPVRDGQQPVGEGVEVAGARR